MKILFVTLVLTFVVGIFAEEKYSTKFKDVDIDSILKNDRLINAYYKCLMEGQGCTPEGEELSNILPEAIQTGCEKCTDDQKLGAKKVASFLIKEKPDLWENLVSKYDPDGTFREKFKEQLKNEGFDI
ncbi:hypothetical protein HHI36_003588 [Cryptolaemus montrouzieri]|uniref:Chemosensory protein n=1 Tax=Cryptolaemus montrouzieri TaxID=559131 RepID=A0ABD2PED5_9CUCU